MVETFSSDKVTFRTPSNINDGAPLRKQPTSLTCNCFRKRAPPQTSEQIPNADLTGGPVNNSNNNNNNNNNNDNNNNNL